MKHGYFKGNCSGVGLNYNGVHYDFPVFNQNFKLVDNYLGFKMEVNDIETKKKYFLEKRMDNKYLILEEELIEKIIKTFSQQQIEFIEEGGEE